MSSLTPIPTIYLSLGEAAQRAAVSPRTLRRAIRAWTLRAYRIGRLVRIADGDLRALVGSRPAGSGRAWLRITSWSRSDAKRRPRFCAAIPRSCDAVPRRASFPAPRSAAPGSFSKTILQPMCARSMLSLGKRCK